MNSRENTLLILWIIFGFVFVVSIDSMLSLLTYLVYFGLTTIGVSFKTQTYILPLFSFSTYAVATIIILRHVKTSSNSNGIYLTKFPMRTFIILAIIAIFLNPITHKLTGIFAEGLSFKENNSTTEYLSFYGWLRAGISFSKWIMLIVLAIIVILRTRSTE